MEAGTRELFRSYLHHHYYNGNNPCIQKIAQWLTDYGGFIPNPWPHHGHDIRGLRDRIPGWIPGLAMTKAKGIMDELWAARDALTGDDEIDMEAWFEDYRRWDRGAAAPAAPENREEPRAGNGHRSASRSRSPVPDHGDSYKDMYLREVNFNVALRSENALLHADNARLRSLATEDRTSANLSN
jgi:hypothetical protein